MRADNSRRLPPEERELDRKHTALAALEARLTQQELELTTLQAELRAFETHYLRVVGRRYAELDAIEAQIAGALAHLHPEDATAQEHAACARTQAQESADAAGAKRVLQEPIAFKPSDSLKKVYRAVARCIHPDLAPNDEERARRHQFMAEVNRAYAEGDEARLRAVQQAWESSPDSVGGEGIGVELVRIIRKIAQVEERLQTIETAMTQLHVSELYQLKTKVEQAEAEGRDLLAIMAESVQEHITQAYARLSEIVQRSTYA